MDYDTTDFEFLSWWHPYEMVPFEQVTKCGEMAYAMYSWSRWLLGQSSCVWKEGGGREGKLIPLEGESCLW